MWFVHPGILAATAGISLIPVVIHLINRRRHRRAPWAATQFLLLAHRRSQRRIRLDHWLLLVLRTIALIVLGVTIARPYVSSSASALSSVSKAVDHAIILDNSLSMQARREDGATSFEAARRAVRRILTDIQPQDRVTLATAAMPARGLTDRPTRDTSSVAALVEAATVTYEQLDLSGAAAQIFDALSRVPAAQGGRILYFVTDLAGELPASLDQAIGRLKADRVVIVNVGPAGRENVAVTDLRFDCPIPGGSLPTPIRYRVTNYGAGDAKNIRARVSIDGRSVHESVVPSLASGQFVDERYELTFGSAGPHLVTVELVHNEKDVLSADDAVHRVADVPESVRVLLIESNHFAAASEQDLFFLRVALKSRNVGSGDRAILVRTVSPAELDSEILGAHHVIVWGGSPRLTVRSAARLKKFVFDGGGLILALGADFDRGLDRAMSHGAAASTPAEPDIREAAESPGWSEFLPDFEIGAPLRVDDLEACNIHFEAPDPGQQVFSDFIGREGGGLTRAVVRCVWPLTRDSADTQTGVGATTRESATITGTSSAEVLLRYSNGLPAVISRRIGAGRVVIMTTGLTMSESSLPSRPDFVPFVLNLVAQAIGDSSERLNIETGEPFIQSLSGAVATSMSVTRPDGAQVDATIGVIGNSLAAVCSDTALPGAYRLRNGGREHWFAVNIRSGESDLRMADDDAVMAAFGPGVLIVSDPAEIVSRSDTNAPSELAGYSVYMLVVFVLAETFVATAAGPRA
ncbi:MAG: BatA domain-containing protein [Phycisphaerae bacterium]|nr:BatA domain-containing protein [Phycisphaerae bacterium]